MYGVRDSAVWYVCVSMRVGGHLSVLIFVCVGGGRLDQYNSRQKSLLCLEDFSVIS